MFISDIDKYNKRTMVTTVSYTAITFFLIIFNIVYTSQSYGESSDYMKYMFLLTLCGGIIPFGIITALKAGKAITRISFNLWNCGIATLVAGCIVRGIINISGRFCDWSIYYISAGIILLACAVISDIFLLNKPQRHKFLNSVNNKGA